MPDTRPLILAVDDQPLNLKALATALDCDYAVQMVTTGPEALALARRPPYPELILLDVKMPQMDGYAVCAALKADPLTAAIPVIFITAQTDAASETAALHAGAVDFIHKPINPEVVRARVHLQRELVQHRHHLEVLVHARTLELAQARDAAESADRAKTAFLRNASHEMCTPLNHITGIAHLLRRALCEPRDQARLDTLEHAAQHLLRLVSDLLDFTRLEAEELVLEPQPFDPRALLTPVIEAYATAAVAKGLDLVTAVDSNLPERLQGDPQRLRQVLLQLLDNAVKFSAQGRIEVRLRAGERQGPRLQVYFEVVDQGIGVDEALATRLFQRFKAGDDSTTRPYPGLGLGLALCQRLVQLMLGAIRLTSVPGQGTTVTFWVPLEITPAVPERA